MWLPTFQVLHKTFKKNRLKVNTDQKSNGQAARSSRGQQALPRVYPSLRGYNWPFSNLFQRSNSLVWISEIKPWKHGPNSLPVLKDTIVKILQLSAVDLPVRRLKGSQFYNFHGTYLLSTELCGPSHWGYIGGSPEPSAKEAHTLQ